MDKKHTERLDSLDVFRGLDMILIMGVPAIVFALNDLLGGPVLGWLAEQMHHARWHGLRIMDLVFPTFLFIAGCSFPLSLSKRRSKGENDSLIYKHIFTRTGWMIFLGCVYNGLFQLDFENLRIASVLGRIGIAWMFASLLVMKVSDKRILVGVVFSLLVMYSLVIGNVLSPDATIATDVYSREGSIVGWIDGLFLPGKLLTPNFDPEGIMSTIPAIASALLGMLAGFILLQREKLLNLEKEVVLLLCGVLLLVLGLVWNIWEPINKSLWTSSFALVAGGIAFMTLALLYWIIDVRKIRVGVSFFRVIGVNSLIIYLGQKIISFKGITNFFFEGFASFFNVEIGTLILSVGYLLICWLFLYYLNKYKIYLKI